MGQPWYDAPLKNMESADTTLCEILQAIQGWYRGYPANGAYPPCLPMADRALLAGYPRYHGYTIRQEVIGLFPKRCGTTACTISLSLICRHFNTYIDYTQYIDGLVQDFSISSVLAMEILQSCTKPFIYILHTRKSGLILKWESYDNCI